MHKYGFHINAVGDRVLNAILRIKPAVIKTLHHDVGFWKRVREAHPPAYIIGRLYTPNQDFQSDPRERGRDFAERILREEVNRIPFRGRPLYDAWESFNEAIPESVSPDVMEQYDAFQVAFGRRMQAAGFEPIAMNFGTGNFLGRHFLEHFKGTLETYRFLGFHEYDWPTMWRLHKESEAQNGGMWLTLRYRRTMNEVRRIYPNRHMVIISECGMTQGVHPRGVGDVGPWHPSHPISEDDYWASLTWYNDELMKDGYVRAACLFAVGAVAPWESFEHLGGIIDRLERLQASQPRQPEVAPGQATAAPSVGQPPVSAPVPIIPAPAPPREQPVVGPPVQVATSQPSPSEPGAASGHYLLLPPDVHWDWYEACRFYYERFRPTWGQNVNDASRAAVVTCVNPSQATLDTMRRLNPSLQLDVILAADPAELSGYLGQRILRGKAYG